MIFVVIYGLFNVTGARLKLNEHWHLILLQQDKQDNELAPQKSAILRTSLIDRGQLTKRPRSID
jgi:hypothetical protein